MIKKIIFLNIFLFALSSNSLAYGDYREQEYQLYKSDTLKINFNADDTEYDNFVTAKFSDGTKTTYLAYYSENDKKWISREIFRGIPLTFYILFTMALAGILVAFFLPINYFKTLFFLAAWIFSLYFFWDFQYNFNYNFEFVLNYDHLYRISPNPLKLRLIFGVITFVYVFLRGLIFKGYINDILLAYIMWLFVFGFSLFSGIVIYYFGPLPIFGWYYFFEQDRLNYLWKLAHRNA